MKKMKINLTTFQSNGSYYIQTREISSSFLWNLLFIDFFIKIQLMIINQRINTKTSTHYLDAITVGVIITCAPVLVRGRFVARVTHTPVGVFCGLAASIDTQIGK